MKKEPIIGDTRTFEKYNDIWTIKDIIKNKNIQFELTLKPIQCPYCGGKFGDKRLYNFNHIEKLEQNENILYMGISDCNRYIMLNEYLSKNEIEEALLNVN